MAACNLRIEINDRENVYRGGDKVSGNVVVTCDSDTNCKELSITAMWSTHGRGNVTSGVSDSVSVPAGTWMAGQAYTYPFQLKMAVWPPTYYGTILNVSHTVRAQAKLRWKFDPKVQEEVVVHCSDAPESLKPEVKPTSAFAKIFIGLLVGIFVVAMLIWLFVFGIFVALIAAVWWFFRHFLPKQLLGNVVATFEPVRASAGGSFRGKLVFAPRRRLTVNQVFCIVSCKEVCSSGSGSNRRTHRHTVLEERFSLIAGPQELLAGKEQAFEFEFPLPANAAPSMKLSDNNLEWNGQFRIDIPKWPDWVKSIPLVVVPSVDPPAVGGHLTQTPPEILAEDQWFNDVLQQLQAVGDDPEKLDLVVEAIQSDEFTVSLDGIYELDEEAVLMKSHQVGKWFEGYSERRDINVQLFVPLGRLPPPEDQPWRGKISILGYNAEHDMVIALMSELD